MLPARTAPAQLSTRLAPSGPHVWHRHKKQSSIPERVWISASPGFGAFDDDPPSVVGPGRALPLQRTTSLRACRHARTRMLVNDFWCARAITKNARGAGVVIIDNENADLAVVHCPVSSTKEPVSAVPHLPVRAKPALSSRGRGQGAWSHRHQVSWPCALCRKQFDCLNRSESLCTRGCFQALHAPVTSGIAQGLPTMAGVRMDQWLTFGIVMSRCLWQL